MHQNTENPLFVKNQNLLNTYQWLLISCFSREREKLKFSDKTQGKR
jgi:hypothetical protein